MSCLRCSSCWESGTKHEWTARAFCRLWQAREPDLDVYAENLYPNLRFGWSTVRALRSGRFKVIDTARPELYDTSSTTRTEHQNLFESRRDVAEAMLQRLRRDEYLSADAAWTRAWSHRSRAAEAPRRPGIRERRPQRCASRCAWRSRAGSQGHGGRFQSSDVSAWNTRESRCRRQRICCIGGTAMKGTSIAFGIAVSLATIVGACDDRSPAHSKSRSALPTHLLAHRRRDRAGGSAQLREPQSRCWMALTRASQL